MSDYAPPNSENNSVLVFKEDPSYESFFHKIESEYLFWNKVKYFSVVQDPKALWNEVKFIRKLNIKKVTLKNSKVSVNYGLNPYLQQKLHYLDFNFGAGIQKEQLLSDIDKHHYLTNSLMEESIFSSMIEGDSLLIY